MLARLVAAAALLGMLVPRAVGAFPGLYVAKHDRPLGSRAATVVLLRDGSRTVVTLQADYRGPAEDFALVIPVPGEIDEELRVVDRRLIDRLDRLTAPFLLEQWERDPCAARAAARTGAAEVTATAPGRRDEATYQDGEYELMLPGAGECATIVEFLRARGYHLSQAVEAALQPYADAGMRFLIAEVDRGQVHFSKEGEAVLSPLRFHFDSAELSLPLKVGTVTAGGVQDLVVFTISVGRRFEAANYPAETMPTTVGLRNEARERIGPVHAALLDAVLARTPAAVVTEYAGSPGGELTTAELQALGTEVAPGLATVRGLGEALVITRLHTRLGVEEIAEDLELRGARPLVGGSEAFPTAAPAPVADPALDGRNDFHTRYVVRHPFVGTLKCDDPLHGVWLTTAPNGEVSEPRHVRAMSDVDRGLPLAEYLAQDLPGLGITAKRRCGCASEEAAPGGLLLGVLALLRRRRGSTRR